MHAVLSKMSFGCFAEEDLENMICNYLALEQVANEYGNLLDELHKRLYGEESKEEIEAYNKSVLEAESITDATRKMEAIKEVERLFPRLWALSKKNKSVRSSLLGKAIEIDVCPISKESFMKAIATAKDKALFGICNLFKPLYLEESFVGNMNGGSAEIEELLKE